MNKERGRIIISGAGIGGLALAQGLLASGLDVHVFERSSRTRSGREGYRLGLSPDGIESLKTLLPGRNWNDLVCALSPSGDGVAFLSQRLEPLFIRKYPPARGDVDRHASIDRATLREILLRGLEGRVTFDTQVIGYASAPGDHVTCQLADGKEVVGDLLIGADGTRSLLRQQVLGSSNRLDTGVWAISGKVPTATQERLLELTAAPIGSAAVITGDRPIGLYIGTYWVDGNAPGQNYVFWSLIARQGSFPCHPRTADPAALLAMAETMTADWDRRLIELIRATEPLSVMALNYGASRDPGPLRDEPVTLIGDAIHNMPPTGGEGANMALKDAATVHQAMTKRGRATDCSELRSYEAEMRVYAFAAVANSMTNLSRLIDR